MSRLPVNPGRLLALCGLLVGGWSAIVGGCATTPDARSSGANADEIFRGTVSIETSGEDLPALDPEQTMPAPAEVEPAGFSQVAGRHSVAPASHTEPIEAAGLAERDDAFHARPLPKPDRTAEKWGQLRPVRASSEPASRPVRPEHEGYSAPPQARNAAPRKPVRATDALGPKRPVTMARDTSGVSVSGLKMRGWADGTAGGCWALVELPDGEVRIVRQGEEIEVKGASGRTVAARIERIGRDAITVRTSDGYEVVER